MAKHSAQKNKVGKHAANPFSRRGAAEAAEEARPHVHLLRKGVRCETEEQGHATPRGRSPLEIVVDATEGFIPLWAKNTTLRWRFRESSFKSFKDPLAAKVAVEKLLGEAMLAWGDAAPIKLAKRSDAWDFEIVMKHADDCDASGCTLAMAFFPDAGRHQLVLYPMLLDQTKKEQLDTLEHEIGHVFGLRHFFAKISETKWASELFGKHSKFSIMNYGKDSVLTKFDKADLKKLYKMAWSGQLKEINGTRIQFVKPFHTAGEPA